MIRGCLTAKETAEYLGIKTRTVWEWARLGILPHVRIQHRVLYRWTSLERFLELRETPTIRKTEWRPRKEKAS